MWEWSNPYPGWVYLILAPGLLLLIAVARRTSISNRLKSWWLFLPRLIVLSLLFGLLLNPIERREHRLPDQPAHVHILVDVSRSMALEQPLSRSQQVQQAIQTSLQNPNSSAKIQLFRFGQSLASVADASQLKPKDDRTNLAAALEQLPSRFGRELPRGVVVFSDGVIDDHDQLNDVAEAFLNLQVPVHVYPVGNSQLRGDVAIDEMVVPPKVDAGVKAPIRGLVRGMGFEGERIVLQVRSSDRPDLPPLATLPITLGEKPQPFEMLVEANSDYGELVLEAPVLEGEVSDANNRVPFQLSKTPRKIRVLYMEGTPSNEYHWVHDALQEDKNIECVSMDVDQQYVQRQRLRRAGDPLRGFPTTREDLLQFDCVICSDIAIGTFTKEQLEWTVELVEKRGGGFVMVGGITSFGAGGWDQSSWDQLIPADMTGGQLGRGWVYHAFNVTVPESAQSHPIWRIVEDPEQNRKVLAAMPQFLGTNYILRLKPAATLLAQSTTPIPQAGIMPIFACQSYGKGRTFAFAPDTTADWGRLFETQWGEGDNRYFRRFWRNVVRWLTENSNSGRRMQIETDKVIYRSGQPIQITARVLNDQARETVDYQLQAKLKSLQPFPDQPIPQSSALIADANGQSYHAELETDSLSTSLNDGSSGVLPPYELEVVATQNGTEISRATTRIMILPDLHELIQPRADSKLLDELARKTGGKRLQTASDLTSLIQELPVIPGKTLISRQPLWDTPWLWLLLLGLLGLEWSLRRLSGFA